MKDKDNRLYLAVFLLIALMVALLVVTVSRNPEVKIQEINNQILKMQRQINLNSRKAVDGRTPVLGVDYFVRDGRDAPVYPPPKNGKDSVSTHTLEQVPIDNYQLALKDGFQGTLHDWLESFKVKGDKGDPAEELNIECRDGKINKRYGNDGFWQLTNIKCEATDD